LAPVAIDGAKGFGVRSGTRLEHLAGSSELILFTQVTSAPRLAMTRPTPQLRVWNRSAVFLIALGAGFALRAAVAIGLQTYLNRQVPPRRCLFPDADIYLLLARAIRLGEPYQVSQWNIPHYALRTPGYPLFLAACEGLFGENLLVARLIQAGIGAGSAWLVYRLVARVWPTEASRVAVWAAILAALEPYGAVLSILLLSEALFVPLMVAALAGIAGLWPAPGSAAQGVSTPRAIITGAAIGAAILVRPSWALFVPALLLTWVVASERSQRLQAIRGALLVCLGAAVVMAPWWIRNARIYGRFVPTALWAGPSLYDGLNPRATGASDMWFLDDPAIRQLNEPTQDATLLVDAWDFARAHPGRALELAAIKSARFWSPWPNAESLTAPAASWASALITLPIYLLIIIGAWDSRHDLRSLALLLGPLVYFWILHMLFVGSVRYRIPGLMPALGLAALGANRLLARGSRIKGNVVAS
jgi:4-amino-4-deoxy-L-arabinose transferase-like glycosyltransferase